MDLTPFSASAKLFVKPSSPPSLQTHRWQRNSNGVTEVFNLKVLANTDATHTLFCIADFFIASHNARREKKIQETPTPA